MRLRALSSIVVPVVVAAALVPAPAQAAVTSTTFPRTGAEQGFTVPAG